MLILYTSEKKSNDMKECIEFTQKLLNHVCKNTEKYGSWKFSCILLLHGFSRYRPRYSIF